MRLHYYQKSTAENKNRIDPKTESLCLALGQGYYIKDDLRKEMEK